MDQLNLKASHVQAISYLTLCGIAVLHEIRLGCLKVETQSASISAVLPVHPWTTQLGASWEGYPVRSGQGTAMMSG